MNLASTSWKNSTCSSCSFKERAPRDVSKPLDLSEPIIYICRHSPPQIVFAVGQGPNRQPIPVPLGSMYPIIDSNFPACSSFKSENVSNFQTVDKIF